MLRRAYHVSHYAVMVVMVLAAVLALALMIGRFSLPRVASVWQLEAQEWLSAQIGEAMTIGELDLAWDGWQLLLQISDLRIGAGDEHDSAVSTGQLYVAVDVPASMAAGAMRFSGIRLEGVELRAERDRDGSFRLLRFSDRGRSLDLGGLRHPAWLLAVDWLEIVDSEIVLTDRYRRDVAHWRATLDLDVRNSGDEHRLSLLLDNAPGFAESVRLHVHASGTSEDPADWSIRAHLQAEALILAALAREVEAVPEVIDGRADLRLWIEAESNELKRVAGDLDVDQLQFQADHPTPVPQSGSTRMLLEQQGDQWSLVADWLTVKFPERSWTVPGLAARFRLDDAGTLENLRAHLSTLPLVPATRLARLAGVAPAPWNRWLQAAAAQGLVHALEFDWWRRPEGQMPGFELSAEIEKFGAKPVAKLPGVTGVSGSLSITGDQALVDLDSRHATVTLPKLLRESLDVERLKGQVRLALGGGGWQAEAPDLVAITPDIKTRTRLRVDWYTDQNRSPELDLQVAFSDGDGSQASRYLPVGIMKPRLSSWLDRAVVAAQVPSGGVIFRGPLRSFPFADRSGTFLVQFGVEDGVLDYHPKWPRAEGLVADFTFRSNSMQATASTGRMLSLGAEATTVSIPWLRKPVLEISTQTRGEFSDMQAFLDSTPLNNSLGDKLRELELAGDARLHLDLRLPIKGLQPKLEGSLRTQSASMNLQTWSLPLTDIAGQVQFSELGIYQGALQGRALGESIRITLEGQTHDDALTTVLNAEGKIPASPFVERFVPQLGPHLQGGSDWSARLEWDNRTPGIRIELLSELRGTAVTLPPPLGKNADDQLPVRVVVSKPANGLSDLEIGYGSILQLLARLGGDSRAPQLERGVLVIGAQPVTMPAEPGVVVQGDIAVLDLDRWRNAVGPIEPGATEALRRVELRIGELRVDDRVFRRLGLQANHETWALEVHDAELFGTIRGVFPITAGPVEADLEWLQVGVPERAPVPETKRLQAKALDPRQLPPLRLRIEELRVNKSAVGSLTLHADPTTKGLELSRLQLAGARYDLEAKGNWIREDTSGDTSSIDARLTSEDLGQTLRDLGLYADISGAPGELSMEATWPSPLIAPSLATLEGQLHIDLGHGEFIEVDTGAGALVGLFSLRGLVRRLSFDFSDLQDKGLSFDSITADISLRDGNATTENLVVDGPQMRLELSGRVGLVTREYDQVVLVTPFMGGSLPLAGLIYGGPVLGAAGYVAGKVFEEEIGKVAQVQYTITGSWDDPVVEREPVTRLQLPAEWEDRPEDR